MTAGWTLVGTRNGHPAPSLAALSLLFGIPMADLDDTYPYLDEWFDSARQRRDEAIAATGCEDVFSALEYWATKDLGRRIVVCGDEALLGLTDRTEP
jgi:hypothetical protein